MRLLDKMARDRKVYADMNAGYGRVPADDEQALRQFVYDAVVEFIERDGFRLVNDLLDDDYDPDAAVSQWIDEWSTA